MLIRAQEPPATDVGLVSLDEPAELTSLSSTIDQLLAPQLLDGDADVGEDDGDQSEPSPFSLPLPDSFPLLIDHFTARIALAYRLIPPVVRYSPVMSDRWHAAGRLANCPPDFAGARIDLLLDMGAMDEDGLLHPQLAALLAAKGKRSAASSGRGKDDDDGGSSRRRDDDDDDEDED